MVEKSFFTKRDPEGYFILLFDRSVLMKLQPSVNILVEDYGDCVIVKTKSRKIARMMFSRFKDKLCVEEL